jgi:hypothetical protein
VAVLAQIDNMHKGTREHEGMIQNKRNGTADHTYEAKVFRRGAGKEVGTLRQQHRQSNSRTVDSVSWFPGTN